MRKARWLAEWRMGAGKPVLYHVISRVVDRRFVLGTEEKEKFRTLMRMQENFTGCRVLCYCLMDNHFHLLLEVPPMAEGGIPDEVLLKRLSALYGEVFVGGVTRELADARARDYTSETGMDEALAAIHERFTYRMHDLGEFMKGLLQRFTQWFNRAHSRTGRLWEDRFKSVIVEDGIAARTMSAYIDLNPVRAGMVEDPAEYRWSSYGEAVGGGKKGNGKNARERFGPRRKDGARQNDERERQRREGPAMEHAGSAGEGLIFSEGWISSSHKWFPGSVIGFQHSKMLDRKRGTQHSAQALPRGIHNVNAQQSAARIFARDLAALASITCGSRWFGWPPGGSQAG